MAPKLSRPRVHQPGCDGGGDGGAGESPDQIRDGCQHNGLPRRQHLGGDDGGNGVGRVVKAVDVGEYQRRQDDKKNEGHRTGQEFFSTICMTTLPASRQRSMTFSINS